ncbi:MAG: hypothetical protein RR256_00380 [Bacteroidales bacterium]
MKKTIILLIVISFVFTTAYAQNNGNTDPMSKDTQTYKKNNTFGFRAGLNYTIIDGTYITPTVGFSYEWVPKWCGIEIGAYYTNYKSDYNDVFASTHYIQIPIFWKIQTKHVNLAIGLQTLWYLGYTINENKSAIDFEAAKQANFFLYGSYTPQPMSLDVGLALRIGFPIKLSTHWSFEPYLGMEYMYEHSFATSVGAFFRFNQGGKTFQK